jgi:hypothetical protein
MTLEALRRTSIAVRVGRLVPSRQAIRATEAEDEPLLSAADELSRIEPGPGGGRVARLDREPRAAQQALDLDDWE